MNSKVSIAIILFIMNICQSGLANDLLPDYYAEPGLGGQRQYAQDLPQEVIDPFGGKLHFSFIDLRLPGNSGLDIVVRRNYTNLDDSAGIPAYQSHFGLGWSTLHFGRVLKNQDANVCSGDSGNQGVTANPILELSDGSRHVLYVVDSFSPSEYQGYLFVTKDRWVATCKPGLPSGLIVHSPNGIRYTFDEYGYDNGASIWQVTEIRDRHDQVLNIFYADPDGGSPRVTRIQDPLDGRKVEFFYKGTPGTYSFRLDRMTAHGRTWNYYYTKARSVGDRQFLTRVKPPAGNSWKFNYNDKQPSSSFKGGLSLEDITYPFGGKISYTYNRVQFDPTDSRSRESTVVATKKTSGSNVVAGSWSYRYQPGINNDTTTITGPNYIEEYQHFGYQAVPSIGNANKGVWKIGSLLQKTIYNKQPKSLQQTELYDWQSQRLSGRTDGKRPNRLKSDADIYTAILKKKTVVRDGSTYMTTYSNFDAYGNAHVIDESGNASRHTEFKYDIRKNDWILHQISREDVRGEGVISRKFDSRGRLENENQYGVTSRYTYYPSGTSAGALRTLTDANTHVTTYSNYFRGIAKNEKWEEAINIVRTIDSFGNIKTYTDGRNKKTGFSWDGLNRLIAIDFPTGHADVIIKWNAFMRNKVLTREAYKETVKFDGFERPISIKRTGAKPSISIDIDYNAIGEKVFASYPSSTLGTTYKYDSLQRVKMVTHGDQTSRNYRYLQNNKVSIVNERNLTTTYTYRSYGDPDNTELMVVTDPEGTTTITRNTLGQLTSVIQNGKTRKYEYNSKKFLILIIDPETGNARFGHDNIGNVTSRKVGNSGTTTLIYDRLDRLEKIDYPNSTEDVSFSYDKNSNLTIADNSVSLWKGDYDARNQPLWEELDGRRVTFVYNSMDALKMMTYPSKHTVTYDPDAFGHPTKASPYITKVEYHPNGYIERINYQNGFNTRTTLTNRQWLDSLKVKKGMLSKVSLDYDYDGLANVIRLSRAQDNYDLNNLVYDGRNRLTQVTRVGETDKISYDDDGDISSYQLGGTRLTYTYNNNNKLSKVKKNNQSLYDFTYDDYGNITGDGQHNYVFDDASQLRTVDGVEQYTYNAHGHRVKRLVGKTVTAFFYTRAGQLLAEYDGYVTVNSWRRNYIYLNNKQVAVVNNLIEGRLEETADEADKITKNSKQSQNKSFNGLPTNSIRKAITQIVPSSDQNIPFLSDDSLSKTDLINEDTLLFYDGFVTADVSAWDSAVIGNVGSNRLEVNLNAALGDVEESKNCMVDSGSRCGLAIILEDLEQVTKQSVMVGLKFSEEPMLQGRFWLDTGLLTLSDQPNDNRLLIAEFTQTGVSEKIQQRLRFYLEHRFQEGYWLRVEHWDEANQALTETGTGYLVEANTGVATPMWLEFEWWAGRAGAMNGFFGLYLLSKEGIRIEPPLLERSDLDINGQTIDSVQFGIIIPQALGTHGRLYFDEFKLWREQ